MMILRCMPMHYALVGRVGRTFSPFCSRSLTASRFVISVRALTTSIIVRAMCGTCSFRATTARSRSRPTMTARSG